MFIYIVDLLDFLSISVSYDIFLSCCEGFTLAVDCYLSSLSIFGVEHFIVGVDPGHVMVIHYFVMLCIDAYICC